MHAAALYESTPHYTIDAVTSSSGRDTLSMTSYTCFEDLEASVPLSAPVGSL